MLSFYTRGTNTIDFMMMKKSNMKKGRLEFERTKTMNRRMDRAFTSIKLEPEALEIIYKYPGTKYEKNPILTPFDGLKDFRCMAVR